MRSLLVGLVLLGSVVPAWANEWTAALEKLKQSVVALTMKDGGWCTAWVVDGTKNLVITAYHCKGEEMMVDGMPAFLVKQDVKRDLLVLRVPDLDRPALVVAPGDPAPGDHAMAYGFGYGLETANPREVQIGDVNTDVEEKGWPGPLISTNITFEPGMSGGPVVNLQGEVVMLVKGGTPIRGVAIGAKLIREKLGRFIPK